MSLDGDPRAPGGGADMEGSAPPQEDTICHVMSQNVATILPTQSVRQRMDDAGVLRLPEVAREWERLTREKLLEGMPETDIAEAVLLPVLGHNYSTRLVAQRLFESEEPVAMTVGSALLVETIGSGSFAQVSIVWHNGGLKVAKVLKVFDGCAPARFGREEIGRA